ncbi:YveK family protein [Paenibacillus sp. GCM10023252]|uniref:YveK family protein n=1 Tax=Paenibacillus sp. GCM10023252 TaxID=3252649 RepID=UPI003622ED68
MELKNYFKIIRNRWWLILAFVLVASVTTGVYSYAFIQPTYSASSKIIVNSVTDYGGGIKEVDMNSINTNLLLINTYVEIFQSPAIMNKVVELYPTLGLTSEELIGMVSVSTSMDSQVMTLQMTDTSYKRAAEAVNAVATVFKTEIPKIMYADNVTILNQADPKELVGPIAPNPELNIFISIVVAGMLSVGLIFLMEYLDDTIKSEEDVNTLLEIPTLASINMIGKNDFSSSKRSKSNKHPIQAGDNTYVPANQ